MQPTQIKYHRSSAELELIYGNGERYRLSAEFLRVCSPSAEVRGHHPSQAILQVEKQDVKITAMEAQGNYAIRIKFDDGHDTGIYAWDFLLDLATHQQQYWEKYLQDLQRAGGRRRSNIIASTSARVWEPKRKD